MMVLEEQMILRQAAERARQKAACVVIQACCRRLHAGAEREAREESRRGEAGQLLTRIALGFLGR
jgi:hypothetical protein